MSEEQTTQQEEQPTQPAPKDDRSSAVKQAQDDSRSYDQKHERYLADLERLHNEP
jgi:hypothetical protein